ncbi:hypothetical protein LCGC14_0971460 [marine sediment metagenome]|uniref:DUF4177 domain-containing protein n=1 Tax=marine sediment metagenome TaxID=412755 RepID=A0A0F9NG12_9ZZZZ
MKIFEYKVIDYELIKPMVEYSLLSEELKQVAISKYEDWLNSHGAEGWQYIGRGDQSIVFMREKT